MEILLTPPVEHVLVTQPFGVNYVDFYTKMGLRGHPGIDFKANRGYAIKAAHFGEVSWCGKGKDGGIGIELWNKENRYKTFYYHHLKNIEKVKLGKKFARGDVIAKADNTGKYTTGDHEHFELYLVDSTGVTINKDNGFKGSVDPSLHMIKDWDKSRAYHRYGRDRALLAEINMRFKNVWLHRQLKKYNSINKIYDNEFINALVYGGWSFDDVMNPAMAVNWRYLKKQDFLKGMRSFS